MKTDFNEPLIDRWNRGRLNYEAELEKHPRYHDGSRRPQWSELSEVAQESWMRQSKQKEEP